MRTIAAVVCAILGLGCGVGLIAAVAGSLSSGWKWDQRHIAMCCYGGMLLCMGLGYALGREVGRKPGGE